MTGEPRPDRARGRRLTIAVLYWLAVLAVSLALVVLLLLWFESRDQSSIGT